MIYSGSNLELAIQYVNVSSLEVVLVVSEFIFLLRKNSARYN